MDWPQEVTGIPCPDRDEDERRFRKYCCRTDETIHSERRGWDTETFAVIRHHHEAANIPFALTSETTMNPDKTMNIKVVSEILLYASYNLP